MTTLAINRPCPYCGQPATTTRLVLMRIRARRRRPTRIYLCETCDRREYRQHTHTRPGGSPR